MRVSVVEVEEEVSGAGMEEMMKRASELRQLKWMWKGDSGSGRGSGRETQTGLSWIVGLPVTVWL